MSNLKKAPVKVNENGTYVDIYPETYADSVYLNDDRTGGNVSTELGDLRSKLNITTETANAAVKMVISAEQPGPPSSNAKIIWIKP